MVVHQTDCIEACNNPSTAHLERSESTRSSPLNRLPRSRGGWSASPCDDWTPHLSTGLWTSSRCPTLVSMTCSPRSCPSSKWMK